MSPVLLAGNGKNLWKDSPAFLLNGRSGMNQNLVVIHNAHDIAKLLQITDVMLPIPDETSWSRAPAGDAGHTHKYKHLTTADISHRVSL